MMLPADCNVARELASAQLDLALDAQESARLSHSGCGVRLTAHGIARRRGQPRHG